MINGAAHVVGSERGAIEKAMRETLKGGQVLQTELTIRPAGEGYQVQVAGAAIAGGSGHVWAVPMVSSRSVQIGRGENTGRTVTYVNVARGLFRIGSWNCEAQTYDIPASSLPTEMDGLVVLLQEGSDRKPYPDPRRGAPG